MRFFGLVLVSIGFLGAVVSVSIGIIESLSEAPEAGANAALIFAVLAGAAFAGGAVFFSGGLISHHLRRQQQYLEQLLEVAAEGAENPAAQDAYTTRTQEPSVVRLGGPGPRAAAPMEHRLR